MIPSVSLNVSPATKNMNLEGTESSETHANFKVPHLRAVIFDLESMPFIDASAIHLLTGIVETYHKRNIRISFFCFMNIFNRCLFCEVKFFKQEHFPKIWFIGRNCGYELVMICIYL